MSSSVTDATALPDVYLSPAELSAYLASLDYPPGYRVEGRKLNREHHWGAGGVFEYRTVLEGPDGPVLESTRDVFYLTLSDDSEDYAAGEIRLTTLLSNGDPVAEAVWGLVARGS